MAQRRTECPKCQSWRVEILKILNPETPDMNARADIRCLDCLHQWEGRVVSPHYREMARLGRIRL